MKKEKLCGIYLVTNKLNGKKYVGQSRNILQRWRGYKNPDNKTYFTKNLRETGVENFSFDIIEVCEPEELNNLEELYINYADCLSPNGYNINAKANGFTNLREKKKKTNFTEINWLEENVKQNPVESRHTIQNYFTVFGKWLSSDAKVVYYCLKTHKNNKLKKAYPKISLIVEITGLSKIKVIDAIKELEFFGWIEVRKIRIKKSFKNEYYFTIPQKDTGFIYEEESVGSYGESLIMADDFIFSPESKEYVNRYHKMISSKRNKNNLTKLTNK